MKTCYAVVSQLVIPAFVILAVLFSGICQAAEPQPDRPGLSQAQAEEEGVTEKKPPVEPPEMLPKYVPGETPAGALQPYSLTFGPGPITGSLAPYGYGAAEDTLARGWRSHRIGPVRVSPYLSYDALYRSNIFQTYSNKHSDFCNMINPGIQFELPLAGTHKLSMGYLGNAFLYQRFSEISHYDQNVNADASFNFNKLSLRVGSTYRNATEEPSVVQNGPFVSTSRERPYNRFTPYFTAAYKMADRWRLEANYQFDALAYTDSLDQFNNYNYNTFGGIVFYKFWPKTSALIQYIASIQTFPNNTINDHIIHTPLIGIKWDPTAKLSGTIKVGYSITDYFNRTAYTRDFDANGLAFTVQVLYKLSRYTQISLVAQRSLVDDVNFGNNDYFNTGLSMTLRHLWHYFDVTSYASFSYYNNAYIFSDIDPGTTEIKKRNDNIFYANVGLSRPLTKWLRVRLDYFYYNRGSNFSTYPTNENKVLLGLQLSY